PTGIRAVVRLRARAPAHSRRPPRRHGGRDGKPCEGEARHAAPHGGLRDLVSGLRAGVMARRHLHHLRHRLRRQPKRAYRGSARRRRDRVRDQGTDGDPGGVGRHRLRTSGRPRRGRGRAGSQVQELAVERGGAWSRTTSPRNLPSQGRDRNQPGAGPPFEGADPLDQDHPAAPGRSLPPEERRKYYAFVDMVGGGADDCVLAIGHRGDDGRAIVDLVEKQTGDAPGYNPLAAVAKFVGIVRNYGIKRVVLDGYAGSTFRHAFEHHGGLIGEVRGEGKTVFYEDFEAALNSGEAELLDDAKMQEQFLTLVVRGEKVDHLPGDHDDLANAVAGLVWLIRRETRLTANEPKIAAPVFIGAPSFT